MNVRSATEDDFDQVMKIDRLSFSAPWICNFFKSSLKEIFLVLEKEREIVGYVITCVCHDLEKAVILRIAVHPDHRGKGAAGILIRTCLDILVQ
ncbi:MAG: GNAT family N-acetyltransferase [Syntrophobacteria bacterium]